jgi:hypothetical protein
MHESRQPTHHGYAVNVKDHGRYAERAALTDEEAETIWHEYAERFWDDADSAARQAGFQGVYSEGRMGGWCKPHPQPDLYTDEEIERDWLRHVFRPFERIVIELLAETRAELDEALEEADRRAAAEPAERAHWEARDVQTIS